MKRSYKRIRVDLFIRDSINRDSFKTTYYLSIFKDIKKLDRYIDS